MYCVKSHKFKNTHCILYFPTSFLCTSKFNSCDQMLEVTIIQTLYTQSLCGMNVVECFFNSSVSFFSLRLSPTVSEEAWGRRYLWARTNQDCGRGKTEIHGEVCRVAVCPFLRGFFERMCIFFQEKVCFLKVVALEWYIFFEVYGKMGHLKGSWDLL